MPGEFCVSCGRTDRPLVDGECADCFAKRVTLVTAPERPSIVICPTCGSRRIGQHWEPSDAGERLTAADLTPLLVPHPEAAIRRADWTELSGSPMQRDLEGTVALRARGAELIARVRFTLKVEHRTCPECSRRSGKFYTARIQLRGGVDDPRESARARRDRLEADWNRVLPQAKPAWRNALSWAEPLPEGWDFYLTDTLAARSLARLVKQRLGAELKESATLWGRKDGHDVYRVTICLRVPRDRAPFSRAGPPARAAGTAGLKGGPPPNLSESRSTP
jgi:nonsense-mediated mRNA decay protein 3